MYLVEVRITRSRLYYTKQFRIQGVNSTEEKVATSEAAINLPYRDATMKKVSVPFESRLIPSLRGPRVPTRPISLSLFLSFSPTLSLSRSGKYSMLKINLIHARTDEKLWLNMEYIVKYIATRHEINLHEKIVRILCRCLFRVITYSFNLKLCYIFCKFLSEFCRNSAKIFL